MFSWFSCVVMAFRVRLHDNGVLILDSKLMSSGWVVRFDWEAGGLDGGSRKEIYGSSAGEHEVSGYERSLLLSPRRLGHSEPDIG